MPAEEAAVKVTDVAVVIATLVGPILAVQAQRVVEIARQRADTRLRVFASLMQSRATPTSGAHVEALNAIPLAFHPQWWEFWWARARLHAINQAWRTLLNHFSINMQGASEAQHVAWADKRRTLETDLLRKMGAHLGFKITDLDYETQIYFPNAHGNELAENQLIRSKLVEILSGNAAVPIQLTEIDPDAAASARAAVQAILAGQVASGSKWTGQSKRKAPLTLRQRSKAGLVSRDATPVRSSASYTAGCKPSPPTGRHHGHPED
ncbi:hypothetical protein AWV79_28255 [Cupriavidus sp. UYMMa02A]|nr:hypothetical protein AWV79_28255 [Cupriavidus sp. UYMMa02A]